MIAFDDVSFSYNESAEKSLNNVSLHIPKGQCVLLWTTVHFTANDSLGILNRNSSLSLLDFDNSKYNYDSEEYKQDNGHHAGFSGFVVLPSSSNRTG